MISVASFVMLASQATLQLPTVFDDHMVVQRGKPIAVWGFDKPNSEITVQLNGKTAKTKTASDGKFMANLPKQKEGGPYELVVSGSSERRIKDVWVGEVWICSGQSNMEWVVYNTLDRAQAKSEANPHIRMFTVQKRFTPEPQTDVVGNWAVATSDSVDAFSAVGYAFAKKLYKELNVPIGMIHTSWGGTLAEAWTAVEPMAKNPITAPIVARATQPKGDIKAAMDAYSRKAREWQVKAVPAFFAQPDTSWTNVDADENGYELTNMPHVFPDDFDGSYFYRKSVELTAAQASQEMELSLGPIDDFDFTYVNGKLVGSTDVATPNFWSHPRKYRIPAGTLKAGKNVIAVHAYDWTGQGGFAGAAREFKLGDMNISQGWKFEKGAKHDAAVMDAAGAQPQAPATGFDQNSPASLYNAMLLPLAPYSIKGAIWYQGESNAGRAVQYETLLNTMIGNWRDVFKQPDFPFYIAQLANFMAVNPNQVDSGWAELRDAQDKVGQMKNCGTACIIDIGDAVDIHPRNKRDVGERLARIALVKDYKKKMEWQGPRFAKLSVLGSSAMVQFKHAKGLTTKDGKSPRAFLVQLDGKQWVSPIASIANSVVSLTVPSGTITAVRYAWQDNPQVNLVNSDGLPAMPFRTDTLPLTTRNGR